MKAVYFEEGEYVKHVIAYAKITTDGYNPGDMIWKPAVVVGVVDFGYEILCEGEIKRVSGMDLEKIS